MDISPRERTVSAHGLVVEWASLYQRELREAWERRERQEPTGVIDPLP